MLVDFSGKQLGTCNDWATILQVNCPFPASTLLFQWTRSKKVSSSRWRLEFVGGLFFIQLPSKLLLTHLQEPPVLVRVVGGFLKWGYLQIIHFNRIFHYKPSILGIPHFLETPSSKNSWTGHVSWTTSTAWTTTMVQRLPRSSGTEINVPQSVYSMGYRVLHLQIHVDEIQYMT